jgi:hypothetical protein
MEKNEVSLIGEVTQEGELIFVNSESYVDNSLYNLRGKEVWIKVSEITEKRSLQQNKLYWGSIIPQIVEFHKETQGEQINPQTIHAFLIQNIAGFELKTQIIFGKEFFSFEKNRSSKMTTVEFTEYIEKIIDHFSKLGLIFNFKT